MNAAAKPRTGVLLIGHAGLPQALLAAAKHVLGPPSRPTRAIGIGADEDSAQAQSRVAGALTALDSGAGVLILIDVPGATPYRIALAAAGGLESTTMVTGVNLAMLIRVYNYPDLGRVELAESAVAAGQRSVAPVS